MIVPQQMQYLNGEAPDQKDTPELSDKALAE